MTIGSSPRAISEDVREADWSPDGSAMAIVHDLGNVPRSARVPARHGAARGQRLLEQSARVAGRQPRRVRGAPAAIRRSRLGQGRRSRRQGDDAHRRAVRRAGAGVDARRFDHRVLRQHHRHRRCCSRCRCRHRAARRRSRSSASRPGSSSSTSPATGDGWRFARICRSACARGCPARRPSATCRGSDRPARARCRRTADGC